MMEIIVGFQGMDWEQLRRQKRTLLDLLCDHQKEDDKFFELNGLINLIDIIQDAAVKAKHATEEEVFGEMAEEKAGDPLDDYVIITKRQEIEMSLAEGFLKDEDREVLISIGTECGYDEELVTRYVDEQLKKE